MASTINGTSTGNGGLVTSGDDSGILQLQTNETTAVTIDASQNVGIGTSSPQSTFQVGSINAGTSESTNKGLVQIQSAPSSIDSAGGLEFKTSSSGSGYGWKIGGLNAAGDPFVIGNRANSATFTERMRIDSSGNLLVGTTSTASYGAGIGRLYLSASGANWQVGPTSAFANFYIKAGTGYGVGMTTTATSWSSDSDERKKTILTPFANAAEKVCTLRAGTGRYLTDTENMSRSFLIAQDVLAVLPEAVDVGEDAEQSLMLRYTDLIPLLTAAIQEQQAQISSQAAVITTLTERITALEGATQ